MGCGDEVLAERLRNCRNQLQERQTRVHVGSALAGFLYQRGHVVTGHVEQALKALRFLVGVNVDALRVFDLSSVLQKLSMTSTTRDCGTSSNLYL